MQKQLSTVLGVLCALAVTAPSNAAVRVFAGTRANVNPITGLGVGRCGPGRRTVSIAPGAVSASGTSSLGNFAPTQSHCITPPLPTAFDSGVFDFAFDAGDHLTGSYTGAVNLTSTPGLFANLADYLVTGGTGRFLGATGTFSATGTLRFANGTGVSIETFQGRLNMPAVPEPATWAMMILGFGAVGAMARRRIQASA